MNLQEFIHTSRQLRTRFHIRLYVRAEEGGSKLVHRTQCIRTPWKVLWRKMFGWATEEWGRLVQKRKGHPLRITDNK